jgi:GTP cyclohydrolase I
VQSDMNLVKLAWEDVYQRLKGAPAGRLFGVPRGGAIVAGLTGRAVDSPLDADCIVDDIVDSGATREKYLRGFNKPFWSLVDRSRPNGDDLPAGWIHFPWEEEDPVADPATNVIRLLEFLGEDPKRDGLVATPRRVVKALQDMTSGYGQDPCKILGRVFQVDYDELVTLDHIEFVSMCEHHMMAFMGQAHIGYIPGASKGVVGISKLARLVDCFARRLQVQERMTRQIAGAINQHLQPLGVAVVVEARHTCVCARGVGKQSSVMRTSAMLGVLRDRPEARAEFLSLVGK